MTHEELLLTPEYYTAQLQIELYNLVENFLEENNMTRTELAKRLGVSKGYVSQVLNGDFDHRMSKFIELSLAVGYKPCIRFEKLEKGCSEDFDAIEKTISEAKKSIQACGYSAMIYKVDYKSGCEMRENKELSRKIVA